MDYESLSRFMTLRYDPVKKPVRKPLQPSDFDARNVQDLEARIVEIIKNDLLELHRVLGFTHASMSLSGGIDSGLTLAMLRTILPDVKLHCISVGFGEKDDEVNRAKELARIFDCDFQGIILENILSDLPKLITVVKEPRWNLYHFYTVENGKKKSDVFFSGDGGDELFGGYTFRYHKFLSRLDSKAGWKEKAKLYLSCHERDWVPDQDAMFGGKVKFRWEKIYQIFKPYFDNSLQSLDQVFLADFNGKLLYDWLPVNAAFAKFLKLNIESMFLTDSMIKIATHIPWQMKFNPAKRTGKLALQSILRKQKGFEKREIVKKGFSVELASLWDKNAREITKRYVNLESEVVRNDIISQDWVRKTTDNLAERAGELDPRYINKMLSILALEVWHRIFVTQTMNHKERL